MKVLTTHPIIVDRKRISPKDYYLNLDANNKEEVKAFQRYAVSKGANLDYISKSTGKLVSGENAIDGIYGGKTKTAYTTYGAEWEKTKTATIPTTTTTTTTTPSTTTTTTPSTTTTTTPTTTTTTTDTVKDEVKVTKDASGNTTTVTTKADGTVTTVVTDKTGKVISKDEKKGMPKALKWGLIIGGGILVLGILVYALTSSSESSAPTPRRRKAKGKVITKTTTTTTVRKR